MADFGCHRSVRAPCSVSVLGSASVKEPTKRQPSNKACHVAPSPVHVQLEMAAPRALAESV